MDTTSHRPTSAELATLIAMADTDEVVRLRLLRAIRDLWHIVGSGDIRQNHGSTGGTLTR
jgi:hypothetical protein